MGTYFYGNVLDSLSTLSSVMDRHRIITLFYVTSLVLSIKKMGVVGRLGLSCRLSFYDKRTPFLFLHFYSETKIGIIVWMLSFLLSFLRQLDFLDIKQYWLQKNVRSTIDVLFLDIIFVFCIFRSLVLFGASF